MFRPSSRASAQSVLTLGLTLSRSIWEIRLAETPIRRAISRRLMPSRSRCSRRRGPICDGACVSVGAASVRGVATVRARAR